MKPNVGRNESYLRIGLGILAGISAITFVRSKRLAAILGMASVSGIETGLTRFCLLNKALGIDNAEDFPRLLYKEEPFSYHKRVEAGFHSDL